MSKCNCESSTSIIEFNPIDHAYQEYKSANEPQFTYNNNDLLIRALYHSNRAKVAERVRDCGHYYRIVRCDTGCKSRFVLIQRCNQANCRHCSRILSAKIKAQYINPVIEYSKKIKDKRYRFAFITLTSHSKPTPQLPKQILRDAKRLFDTLYPGPDQGAFYKLDIGISGNIHLHCIVFGKYVDHKLISDLWKKIHGASIIHIEACYNPAKAANYISKYLVKPALEPNDVTTIEEEDPTESQYFIGLVALLKGTIRTQQYRCTGIFHKLKFKKIKIVNACPICGGKVKFEPPASFDDFPIKDIALYHSLGSDVDPPIKLTVLF